MWLTFKVLNKPHAASFKIKCFIDTHLFHFISVSSCMILSTLKYEKLKGRNPVERDASAEKVGWDVDSSGRKIEVKGASKASGYDLILSKNEQRALFSEKDYYIYIVSNALSKPLLSVISGKNLRESKDSEDVKLVFTYKAWNETTNAKTDEYPF